MNIQDCIENSTACHNICVATAAYCLDKGGSHAEAAHLRLLLDCADICRTSADFMLRGSPLHTQTCAVCADICAKCAEACRAMGDDDQMRRCADICEHCAQSCREMSRMAA